MLALAWPTLADQVDQVGQLLIGGVNNCAGLLRSQVSEMFRTGSKATLSKILPIGSSQLLELLKLRKLVIAQLGSTIRPGFKVLKYSFLQQSRQVFPHRENICHLKCKLKTG